MPTLYAQPYATGADGFEFSSLDDFDAKADKAKDDCGNAVEEFEIQFLDGDDAELSLFELGDVGQHNIDNYFDLLELDDHERVQAAAVLELNGGDVEDALGRYQDMAISQFDSAEDYAVDYIESLGGPMELGKETFERYFDYESFGRDLELGGDISRLTFGGQAYFYEPHSI